MLGEYMGRGFQGQNRPGHLYRTQMGGELSRSTPGAIKNLACQNLLADRPVDRVLMVTNVNPLKPLSISLIRKFIVCTELSSKRGSSPREVRVGT